MTKPFIISVNSVSGGGKTALCVALHETLQDSILLSFDDFDESNVYPSDYYEWSRRGGDIEEFDCPGLHAAVVAEVQKMTTKQIVLDFPFGKSHSRFRELIDLAVFIDTPLDVAMARRILRDYTKDNRESAKEVLHRLREDMSSYLSRSRYPYLDTYRDKANSDLILDGWQNLNDLKTEVLSVVRSRESKSHIT